MKLGMMIRILLSFSFLFYNCDKSIEGPNNTVIDPVLKKNINGYIQKGPYINGSSISFYELNMCQLWVYGV